MDLQTRLLNVIPSTEPSRFFDVVRYLGPDEPERGDKAAWRELFQTIGSMERQGLVVIERDRGNRIESLQLTDEGAALARETRRA